MATKRGLRTIAVVEAAKGVLVLFVGLGLAHLAIGDQAAIGEDIVAEFHLNPANKMPGIFLKAANSSDTKLWVFAFAAAVYSSIRFAEAWGLWFSRRWAEWVGAIGAALYVPIEIYELMISVTVIKVTLLVLNVLIVVYLCQALRRKRNGA